MTTQTTSSTPDYGFSHAAALLLLVARKYTILFGAVLLALGLLLLSGCAGETTTAPDDMPQEGPLELVDYRGAFFSMKIPKGWQVDAGVAPGDCAAYWIIAYDPADPIRRVFYVNKLADFCTSPQQAAELALWKEQYPGTTDWIYPVVLSPMTPSNMLESLPALRASAESYSSASPVKSFFPRYENIRVAASVANPPVLQSLLGPTELMRAVFTVEGTHGQGMFLATVSDLSPPWGGGLQDGNIFGARTYGFAGVTAGQWEYYELQPSLLASATSIVVDTEFSTSCTQVIKQDIATRQNDINKTQQETFEIIQSSWESRQRSQDVQAEKFSDYIRDQTRIYDPEEGTVYHVPTSDYTANRSSFEQEGYRELNDGDGDLWLQRPETYR